MFYDREFGGLTTCINEKPILMFLANQIFLPKTINNKEKNYVDSFELVENFMNIQNSLCGSKQHKSIPTAHWYFLDWFLSGLEWTLNLEFC